MPASRRPKNQRSVHTQNDAATDDSKSNKFRILTYWKSFTGFFILAIALYMGLLGYLETRVNTPFFDDKVIQETALDVPERYWGTYRPGHYFGIRSRDPKSPLFGLMWYNTRTNTPIRHWCNQGDNMATYGYVRHDGVSVGDQTIIDGNVKIQTTFLNQPSVTRGGHWTARINVTGQSVLSVFFYVALDESLGVDDSHIAVRDGEVVGYTPELGNFRLTAKVLNGQQYHKGFVEAHAQRIDLLKEKVEQLLKPTQIKNLSAFILKPDIEVVKQKQTVNFIVIQMIASTPSSFEIVYKNMEYEQAPLQGAEYNVELERRSAIFEENFKKVFDLNDKGYTPHDQSVALMAFSNMLGGIGYFYGAGKVQSHYTKEPVPYWKAPLYTAVPSRSFFPRGFLWDEGFHGLLISRWNPDIFMDIAGHWLDLMNVEGWIPREQILGLEALARVPQEFVVQSNTAANPPMLMITIAKLVDRRPDLFHVRSGPHRGALERMYPRLQAWFHWFQTTQRGSEATSYMWHGRDGTKVQLNPLTLSSGLDDYPRASHPSDIERHVDLRCWMYAASDAMHTIAAVLDADNRRYEALRDQLGDERLLNVLHWSEEHQMYADYGLHSDDVKIVKVRTDNPRDAVTNKRVVMGRAPKPQLVTSAYGYISLFPLLLKVLRPRSAKLGTILAKLDDPNHLWSPYGLRSLSLKSPYYMMPNTETDKPYWRGQVWININYLALAALKHYADIEGPFAMRAKQLHDELKKNVVRTIVQEFKRTSYLWEQYSDQNGQGSGCRPFTGWTALLPLIMAEDY